MADRSNGPLKQTVIGIFVSTGATYMRTRNTLLHNAAQVGRPDNRENTGLNCAECIEEGVLVVLGNGVYRKSRLLHHDTEHSFFRQYSPWFPPRLEPSGECLNAGARSSSLSDRESAVARSWLGFLRPRRS